MARIQFRYPDGRHTNSTFEANAFLQSLFEFVDADPINVFGAGNYTLSSSFPTRQLDKVGLQCLQPSDVPADMNI